MIIKILIIIGIVIVGTVLLFPQNQDFFINDIYETKDELNYFKDDTVNDIEKTIDNTVNTITTNFDNTINGVFVKPN